MASKLGFRGWILEWTIKIIDNNKFNDRHHIIIIIIKYVFKKYGEVPFYLEQYAYHTIIPKTICKRTIEKKNLCSNNNLHRLLSVLV